MPGRQPPSVSLVVLNWNGKAHLERCLRSLLQLEYDPGRLEVILCDNGSTDGSAEYVRGQFPEVKLVVLDRNVGFADGNDVAAEQASGEWLGFLNNDMWVERGWLRDLVSALDDHPRATCLASRIKNWDGSALDFVGGGVNYQGHGFQVDHGKRSSPRDVERRVLFACGGAMLIRRDAFTEVGGFDPDYFAYFEDVDLGWRLNLLGHEVWYTPRATAFHRHHGTASRLAAHKLRVLYERNALFTIYKCLEQENLDRVLPAALLLLNERALRLAQHDPQEFRLVATGPDTPTGPGAPPPPRGGRDAPGRREPLMRRARRVLGEEGPGTAFVKSFRLARWHAVSLVARTSLKVAGRLRPDIARPGPSHVLWPNIAASHFEAVSQFAHALDRLNAKRCWLQERRQVADRELVPLFEDPLFANYTDERYLDFYRWITRVQGLDRLFDVRPD
jgi:GT2 family glycosyltransferase